MNNPGNKTFLSGDSPVLEISEVVTKLNVVFSVDGHEIMNETYFPDASHKVSIRDIGKLALVYFPEISVLELDKPIGYPLNISVKLTDDKGSNTITLTVYPCDLETAGTLSFDNLLRMPLSRTTEKVTVPTRKEVLSFYGNSSGRAIKAGVAYQYENKIKYVSGQISTISDVCVGLDVSPAKMVEVVRASANGHDIREEDICFYTVFDGYSFRYTVNPLIPDSQHTFLFRNSFHAPETFTCTGDRESERKWNRTTGTVNNTTCLINRELVNIQTVFTGYLTDADCEVLEDLLHSKEIYLLTESGPFPVIIAGESFKIHNRKDDVMSASFEYRPSSNNHNQYRFRRGDAMGNKIFDKTFDDKFN